MRLLRAVAFLSAACACAGCDDPKAGEASAPSAASATADAPAAPPKNAKFTVMPAMFVDETGVGIGPERIDLSAADGSVRLKETVKRIPFEEKAGEPLELRTTPKASRAHVAALIEELGAAGASRIVVKMDGGRGDLPKEITLTPAQRVTEPDGCTVVAMVLEDLSTAVWPVKGGVGKKARKSPFSGPDLSITGEHVADQLKGCDSKAAFFSAAASLPWEHAFHIGAVIRGQDADGKIDKLVFLAEEPAAGRPVKLSK